MYPEAKSLVLFATEAVLPAGIPIPEKLRSRLAPDPTASTAEGLDALRYAVSRCQSESQRASHPLFGKLTRDEWDRHNLRHAELHMSFVFPVDE
jgi:hypothetical protein